MGVCLSLLKVCCWLVINVMLEVLCCASLPVTWVKTGEKREARSKIALLSGKLRAFVLGAKVYLAFCSCRTSMHHPGSIRHISCSHSDTCIKLSIICSCTRDVTVRPTHASSLGSGVCLRSSVLGVPGAGSGTDATGGFPSMLLGVINPIFLRTLSRSALCCGISCSKYSARFAIE